MIGEVRAFTGGIPSGWLPCDGQSLAVGDYPQLYAVIGTVYGGQDGAHFNLPNLQGRVVVGASASGPALGATGGATSVSLDGENLPVHTHGILAVSATGDQPSPVGQTWGTVKHPCYAAASSGTMAAAACEGGGRGYAHANMQPFLVVLYAIDTQ